MMQGVWKSDWLVGFLITLVLLLFSGSDLLQGRPGPRRQPHLKSQSVSGRQYNQGFLGLRIAR